MSQEEDLKAIDAYIMRQPAKTSQQSAIQSEWRRWYSGLSWLQRTAYADTLTEAKRRRQLFDAARGYPVATATAGAPLVVPVTAGPKPTIKQGSSGDAVKEWQRIVGASPVDGKFGPATKSLTVNWQKARGLTADGIVGPQTWSRAAQETQLAAVQPAPIAQAAKQASVAVKAQAAAKPAPAAKAKPVATKPTIKQGSKGDAVKEWQRIVGASPVDGIFGAQTKALTVNWQKARGLTADGIVGPQTWTRAADEAAGKRPAPIMQAAQQAAQQVAAASKPAAKPKPAATKPAATKPAATKPAASAASTSVEKAKAAATTAATKAKAAVQETVTQARATVYEMPLWLKVVGGGLLAVGGFKLGQSALKKTGS